MPTPQISFTLNMSLPVDAMMSALESLEHEAVSLFEARRLCYSRGATVAGLRVDFVVAGIDSHGDQILLGLQLRSWPTAADAYLKQYAVREAKHLRSSRELTVARILVPGEGR